MRLNKARPLLSRKLNFFEFTVIRIFMKPFRTISPAVVNYCQLAFNFLSVYSQLDMYLVSLTARSQLGELFAQFDNVTISCPFR